MCTQFGDCVARVSVYRPPAALSRIAPRHTCTPGVSDLARLCVHPDAPFNRGPRHLPTPVACVRTFLMENPRKRKYPHREARWASRAKALLAFARTGRFGTRDGGVMPSALSYALVHMDNGGVVGLLRRSRDLRLIMMGFACGLRPMRKWISSGAASSDAQAGREIDALFMQELDAIQHNLENGTGGGGGGDGVHRVVSSNAIPVTGASADGAPPAGNSRACLADPSAVAAVPLVSRSAPPPPPLPAPPFVEAARRLERARSAGTSQGHDVTSQGAHARPSALQLRQRFEDDDDGDAGDAMGGSDSDADNDLPGRRSEAALRFGASLAPVRRSSVASRSRRGATPDAQPGGGAVAAAVPRRSLSEALIRSDTKKNNPMTSRITNGTVDAIDASAQAARMVPSSMIGLEGEDGDSDKDAGIAMTQPYDV